MKRLTIPALLALGSLPTTLLAHGGLDHSSALMVVLHTLAHAINNHPVLAALSGVAVAVGLSLHYRRVARRQASG
jgi:hypothetical protein